MISMTIVTPLSDDEKAQVLAFINATGATPISSTSSGLGSTVTQAINYFPADPGLAPFPSPENSEIIYEPGPPAIVGGQPYLKDKDGSIHTLKLDATGVPRYFVNGTQHSSADPTAGVVQAIVRAEAVYIQIATGQWQWFNPAMGSLYNAALPAAETAASLAAASAATANVAQGVMPADPTPSTVAPGSSGTTILCGVGQALSTISAGIAAAKAGDTVLVEPSTTPYKETPPWWTVPIHLILTGTTIDATGLTSTLAHGMGLLVPGADCIIDAGEITGVAMDQTSAQNTSAIRPNAGCNFLTVNGGNLHGNQSGIGEGGFATVITVNGTTLDNNGLGEGQTHNIYVAGDRLILNNVVSTNPNGGHAVKSRALHLEIHGGVFTGGNDETIIDIPDGTRDAFVIDKGAVFNKPASAANHGILGYALESSNNGVAGGTIDKSVTINALCDSPLIQSNAGTITISATLTGNKITASGTGKVTGL